MFAFKDFDYLTNGEINLLIDEKKPANVEKDFVPAYKYRITLHGQSEQIGVIDIRIGYNEKIHYGGNIGYEINQPYRGHHFAAKACQLVKQVAIAHGMKEVRITCNPDNLASRRTCEIAGLNLVDIADLPPENEMRQEGDTHKCIYQWNLREV